MLGIIKNEKSKRQFLKWEKNQDEIFFEDYQIRKKIELEKESHKLYIYEEIQKVPFFCFLLFVT